MVNKTYKFCLYPAKEQEVLLNQHFGHSRWVYNHFLNERKEQYQADKKSDNYYKQAATLKYGFQCGGFQILRAAS